MTEIIENIEEEAREQDNIIERVQKIEENSIKSRRRPSVASSRIFGKKKRKK